MSAGEHALMEASLEALAEVAGDVTPSVYARFFARRPETQALFIDELGRGRMLYEILQTCLEFAEGRHYAPGSLASLAGDHRSYGDFPLVCYREFLDDLLAVMAEALGPQWTPQVAAAWGNQTGRMADCIEGALTRPAPAMPVA